MSFRRDRASGSDRLAEMRGFVADLMAGRPAARVDGLPHDLLRRAHLGPIAYRRGVSEFRGEYAASAVMAERRRAALCEICSALAGHGIRVALLKGIAWAGDLYPDPAERPMHDIDLLIQRRDLPAAKVCMTGLGYVRVGSRRELSGYYHAVGFSRGELEIELHRSIVQHSRTNLRIGEIWRRATPDPRVAGAERLDPVDDLLIAALHIARHELSVPVINYVDVARLRDRMSSDALAELHSRARRYRIGRAVGAVLSMTDLLRAGKTGRPAIFGSAVLPTSDEILSGATPPRIRQIGQKLLLTEGPRELIGLGLSYAAALAEGRRRGAP